MTWLRGACVAAFDGPPSCLAVLPIARRGALPRGGAQQLGRQDALAAVAGSHRSWHTGLACVASRGATGRVECRYHRFVLLAPASPYVPAPAHLFC